MNLNKLRETLKVILEGKLEEGYYLSIGIESKAMELNYLTIEVEEAHINDDYICFYKDEDIEVNIPFTEDMKLSKVDEGDEYDHYMIKGNDITIYFDFIWLIQQGFYQQTTADEILLLHMYTTHNL